ncbi:type II toxin-antitoxin system RelE/ParE family toxin [Sphaerospermopsis sp. LEGE 00249]|nr:type II toxin-antitoxin system RelE/ParE family toxin [Sphaerospermopsis sp. LEGE 00249]
MIRALDGLITGTENLDIKPLKGREESRLRVGKYRILFIENTVNQLYVIMAIGAR